MLTPTTTAMFAKAGMLTADGRCKTLDAAADGYVRGEACIVFALRACEGGALPTGTLAIFAGAATNQDARSSSLTAPNGRAQQSVVRAVLRGASLEPGQVSMLQLHGTGTALGTTFQSDCWAANRRLHVPVFSRGPHRNWCSGHASRGPRLPLAFAGVQDISGPYRASSRCCGLAPCPDGCPFAGCCGYPAPSHRTSRGALTLSTTNPIHIQVNPHIQAASMAHMSAPRQPAPFVEGSQGVAVGVSAFAFQGTNAHALLTAPPHTNEHIPAQGVEMLWKHEEVSVAPPVHPVLRGVTASSTAVTFSCALQHPCNAFLRQHVVGGRALLPATAYLEAMHTALTMLGARDDSALTDVAFKRPFLLEASAALQVRVQPDSGVVEVVSGSAVHATARVGVFSSSKAAWCAPLVVREQRAASSGVADVALQHEAADLFTVHPAALDSVLQLAAGCQQPGQLPSAPSVPASLAAYAAQGAAKHALHAVASTRASTRGGATSTFRMLGVCSLAELVSLPLSPPKQAAAPSQTGVYALSWLAQELDGSPLMVPLLKLEPNSPTAALSAVQCAGESSLTGANMPASMAGLLRSAGSELGSCTLTTTGGAPFLLFSQEPVSQSDGYGQKVNARASKVAVLRRSAHPQPLRYQLRPEPRGALQNLVAGQVDTVPSMPMLHVQATGINFRDVLNVLVRECSATSVDIPSPVIAAGHVSWRSWRTRERLRGRGNKWCSCGDTCVWPCNGQSGDGNPRLPPDPGSLASGSGPPPRIVRANRICNGCSRVCASRRGPLKPSAGPCSDGRGWLGGRAAVPNHRSASNRDGGQPVQALSAPRTRHPPRCVQSHPRVCIHGCGDRGPS